MRDWIDQLDTPRPATAPLPKKSAGHRTDPEKSAPRAGEPSRHQHHWQRDESGLPREESCTCGAYRCHHGDRGPAAARCPDAAESIWDYCSRHGGKNGA